MNQCKCKPILQTTNPLMTDTHTTLGILAMATSEMAEKTHLRGENPNYEANSWHINQPLPVESKLYY